MEPFSSLGGAPFLEKSKKVIRLLLKGCVNRPFFHISIQELSKTPEDPAIEQIGNYDPLPNQYNEKLVAINFQRLEYWLRKGAEPTESVKKLLGLCGYFPVHPESFKDAYFRRKEIIKELENLKIEAVKFSSVKSEETVEPAKELSNESDSNSSSSASSSDTSVDDSTTVKTEESQPSSDPKDETPKN